MFTHLLLIGWIFTAGYCPIDQTGYTYNDCKYVQNISDTTHIGMNCNALIMDHLNIRGGIDSWQYARRISSWVPYKIGYNIGADVYLRKISSDDFNIFISIDRSCYHPVTEWGDTNGKIDSCYCEIKLTVKSSTVIF